MALRLMMPVAPLILGIILLLSKVNAQSKLFVDPDRQACERSEAFKNTEDTKEYLNTFSRVRTLPKLW